MADDRPDYYLSTVIKGFDDPVYRSVAVDEHGNLLGLLQGHFDSVVKTIAVDADGVMKANLVAQQLTRAITKLSHGEAIRGAWAVTVPALTQLEIFNSDMEGIMYGGFNYLAATADHSADVLEFKIDGNIALQITWRQLNERGLVFPISALMYLLVYDNVFYKYSAGFMGGLTFESNITFNYTNNHGTLGAPLIGNFIYARIV